MIPNKRFKSFENVNHGYIIQVIVINRMVHDFQEWTGYQLRNASHFDYVNKHLQTMLTQIKFISPYRIFESKEKERINICIWLDKKYRIYDLSDILVVRRKEWARLIATHPGIGWDIVDGTTYSEMFVRDALKFCFDIIESSKRAFGLSISKNDAVALNALVGLFNSAAILYSCDCRIAELRRIERFKESASQPKTQLINGNIDDNESQIAKMLMDMNVVVDDKDSF